MTPLAEQAWEFFKINTELFEELRAVVETLKVFRLKGNDYVSFVQRWFLGVDRLGGANYETQVLQSFSVGDIYEYQWTWGSDYHGKTIHRSKLSPVKLSGFDVLRIHAAIYQASPSVFEYNDWGNPLLKLITTYKWGADKINGNTLYSPKPPKPPKLRDSQ